MTRPDPTPTAVLPDPVRQQMQQAVEVARARWQAGVDVAAALDAGSVSSAIEGAVGLEQVLLERHDPGADVEAILRQYPDLPTELVERCWPKPGEEYLGLRIQRELGSGGFAHVYLAVDEGLGGRPVVLKLSHVDSPEPQTLGRLDHPGVVPVHWVRRPPEAALPTVCMPFFGCSTLLDLLASAKAGPAMPADAAIIRRAARARFHPDDPPPSPAPAPEWRLTGPYPSAVARLGAQLADALAYLHAQGVVHRDLKPSNVLLTALGRPMVLDFNCAAAAGRPENFVGTPAYMAPEQLLGTTVGPEADVFALGVVLYELLTGAHPFGGAPRGHLADVIPELVARQRGGARLAWELNPQVDRSLGRLIARCLTTDPARRPTAAALARGLRWAPRARVWRLAAAAAAVVALTLTAGATALPARQPPLAAAHASLRDGDAEGAVEHAERARVADPDSPDALLTLGRAHQRRGDVPAALAALDRARQARWDTAGLQGRAHAAYAHCLSDNRQYKAATAAYRQAVAAGYAPAVVYNNLGHTLCRQNDLTGARAALDRAVTLDPKLRTAHCNRAEVDFLTAQRDRRSKYVPRQGLADIRRADELGPPAARVCLLGAYLCALVSERGGNETAAGVAYLRRALELGHPAAAAGADRALAPLWGRLVETPLPAATPCAPLAPTVDPLAD